jgi:signal transduction histidine kinase
MINTLLEHHKKEALKKRMEEIDGQINFTETNGTCISISIKIDH